MIQMDGRWSTDGGSTWNALDVQISQLILQTPELLSGTTVTMQARFVTPDGTTGAYSSSVTQLTTDEGSRYERGRRRYLSPLQSVCVDASGRASVSAPIMFEMFRGEMVRQIRLDAKSDDPEFHAQ